jgi:RNA polymerase sigma factor (sigma-70 family)
MGEVTTLSTTGRRGGAPLGLLGDEALARLAAQGNRRAFETIYERHHQALFRYIRAIVHNEEDATDALQAALVKAMKGLPNRKHEAPLKPWLFRIAHNEAIDLLRRRRPTEDIEAAEEASDSDPERDAAMRERLQQLVADLRELPERQRGALVMRELSGLDYEEIGTAFGISPGAAKQAVYEARVALHEKDAGRAMDCDDIRRRLSDGDRRILRGRRVRAHLSTCASCTRFATALRARPSELAALAPPLAPAAAAGLLKGIFGSGSGGAGATSHGGAAAALIAGTGKVIAGSLAIKAALVAGTATAGAGLVTAATGDFPIDLPGPIGGDDSPAVVQHAGGGASEAPSESRIAAAVAAESGGGSGEGSAGDGDGGKDSGRGGEGRRRRGAGSLVAGPGRRRAGGGLIPNQVTDRIRSIQTPQVPDANPPRVEPPPVQPPSGPSLPPIPPPPSLP